MTTSLAPLLAYAAALAIAAGIPGPGVLALAGQAMGGGMRAALAFLAGIFLGDLFYLSVAVAGLAALAQLFSGVFLAVKVAGGFYLLYLACRFWTSEAGLARAQKARSRGALATFLSGFALTLGNPKTIIFYLAVLPGVVDLQHVAPGDWALLALVTGLVLFAVLTPYAVLADRAQGALIRSGAPAGLARVGAAFLGAAGAAILGQAALGLLRRA